MNLRRYFHNDYAVQTLEDLHFKVTEPIELNDPFENSPYIGKFDENALRVILLKNHQIKDLNRTMERITKLAPDILQSTLEQQKLDFSKKNKVLCLTMPLEERHEVEAYEDILLWGHYANGHAGVRISFDAEKLRQISTLYNLVTYTQDRVMIDPIKILRKDPELIDTFLKVLFTKSVGWKYEHEVRWFIKTKECVLRSSAGKDLYFIRLPPEAIVRVDIGVNASMEFKKEIMTCIKRDELAHVDVRCAKIHGNKFQLEYLRVTL